jgi:hypothetical protein
MLSEIVIDQHRIKYLDPRAVPECGAPSAGHNTAGQGDQEGQGIRIHRQGQLTFSF